MEEPLADLFERAARGELRAQRRHHLSSLRSPPCSRRPRRPAHAGQALARPLFLMTTFRELGLSEPILEALTHLGYEEPTPIQEQAIPALLEGRDVIGQAQTGTGKTAAFGLPLLEYVDPSDPEVQALVLTPTRELCIQVTQALRAYGQKKGVSVVAVFGGAPIRDQMSRVKENAQVVVGTVGRVMDLMGRHALVVTSARYVVLDEADEMLDLGFFEDVETILSRCPVRPPDGALLGDDAARDQAPGRAGHVRPGHDQGEGGDADDRHRRAVLRRRLRPRQAGEARRGGQGGAAGPGDHLRPHEDRRRPAVTPAERRRRAREGAARRHVAGPARRRDDRVQVGARAAARGHRRRRARARHLRRHARHQLRRPELARTSTSTGSAAPAASGARAGRSRSSRRSSAATSRRSSATPRPRSARGRRTRPPHRSRSASAPSARPGGHATRSRGRPRTARARS